MQTNDTHREIIRRLKGVLGEFSDQEIAELNHVVSAEVNRRLTSRREEFPPGGGAAEPQKPSSSVSLEDASFPAVEKLYIEGLKVSVTDSQAVEILRSGEFQTLLSTVASITDNPASGIGMKGMIRAQLTALDASFNAALKQAEPFRTVEDRPQGASRT